MPLALFAALIGSLAIHAAALLNIDAELFGQRMIGPRHQRQSGLGGNDQTTEKWHRG